MGANMTNKAITKAARSVSTLHKFREEFDSETEVPHLEEKNIRLRKKRKKCFHMQLHQVKGIYQMQVQQIMTQT